MCQRDTIGGYQVMKKWLSYREAPLLGRDLRNEEAREVQAMARRIAAILLLEPALDDRPGRADLRLQAEAVGVLPRHAVRRSDALGALELRGELVMAEVRRRQRLAVARARAAAPSGSSFLASTCSEPMVYSSPPQSGNP